MSFIRSLPNEPIQLARVTTLDTDAEGIDDSFPVIVGDKAIRTAELPTVIMYFQIGSDELLVGLSGELSEWVLISKVGPGEEFEHDEESLLEWAKEQGNLKYGELDIVAANRPNLPDFLPD